VFHRLDPLTEIPVVTRALTGREELPTGYDLLA